ncbi:MAG: hypothetical protein EBR82_17540 [Caulobacteraceae bacterium]|nr:hypothetical protein [Caulobacteraceae bacterium]
MHDLTTILGYLVTLLGAGGLSHLITLRLARKKMSNQIAGEEFSSMEEIVNKFSNRISAMAEKTSDLINRNSELEEKIAQLEREKNAQQK